MRAAPRLLAAVFVLALVLSACSGSRDTGGASGAVRAEREDMQRGADQDRARGGVVSAAGTSGGGASTGDGYAADEAGLVESAPQPKANAAALPDARQAPALQGGPSVIKTALVQVSVEREEFRTAVQRATSTAERLGGYVVSTSVSDRERGFASVTMRIPSTNFASALNGVRGLGDVKREEISGQDVTEELVDLAARIKHLRAQERVLLDLMNEANTVSDTIRVQNELSGVQLNIERLRGRLRFLDDQVAMSTITVEMRKSGAPAPGELGTLGRAWQKAIDGFLGVVSGVIIATGVVIPIALLALLAALGFRVLRPVVARKTGAAA